MINSKDKETNSSNSSKETKPQTYRVIKMIGEGSFGKAYLVECNSDKVIYFNLRVYV
jgi:hypothetical protein